MMKEMPLICGKIASEECMDAKSRESEDNAVKRSLESSYCPEPIRQARERQDRVLGERLQPGPYKIADLGCGNGEKRT
jgi:hypothetical protein